jgi:putative Ca2+/H+ antiporter (TMEM165/GDT1 family)
MAALDAITTSFVLILLAEMGDKTQLALFSLSAKYNARLPVLLGAFGGFAVVDGLAIIFGSAIANLVPQSYITYAAGALFLVFGILFFRSGDEEDGAQEHPQKSILLGSFLLITLMEFGDKTQIISLALAARFDSLVIVFAGVMAALMTLSIMAVLAGAKIAEHVPERTMKRISGTIFIVLGLLTLAGVA